MSCTVHITEDLRGRGFRMTPQRQSILQILYEDGGHLSPSKIYEKAAKRIPGLTEATVYRTLEFLTQNHIINSSQDSGGHLVYEIASDSHHHIICRSCSTTIEIDHSLLNDLYLQLNIHTGFGFISNHLTFFGLCSICQSKNR